MRRFITVIGRAVFFTAWTVFIQLCVLAAYGIGDIPVSHVMTAGLAAMAVSLMRVGWRWLIQVAREALAEPGTGRPSYRKRPLQTTTAPRPVKQDIDSQWDAVELELQREQEEQHDE